jgi:hypothetical protein
VRGNTDTGAIREAKGVKVWDPDIGAVFLHPAVSGHLAGDLLVDSTGMPVLGELVGKRTAEHETAGRLAGRLAGLNVNKNAEIEPSLDP